MQDAKQYQIDRTGNPPLRFTGSVIGQGTTKDHNSTRWTDVNIYVTKGGKFIAQVSNRTQWEGEHDYVKAASFETAKAVIDYLRNDEGILGRASQEALEYASGQYEGRDGHEAFKAAFVEEVE